jgi:hypothetical protein
VGAGVRVHHGDARGAAEADAGADAAGIVHVLRYGAVTVVALVAVVGCATKVTCLCRGDGGMKAARVVVRPGLTEREFLIDTLEGCREMCTGRLGR